MWHVTRDMWHLTCDTWHMTCDILRGVNNFSKFQLPMIFWKGWLTDWLNNEGVCKTALATSCLLNKWRGRVNTTRFKIIRKSHSHSHSAMLTLGHFVTLWSFNCLDLSIKYFQIQISTCMMIVLDRLEKLFSEFWTYVEKSCILEKLTFLICADNIIVTKKHTIQVQNISLFLRLFVTGSNPEHLLIFKALSSGSLPCF